MQFHQRQLTRSTTLSLRTHGLHVSQRDGQGRLKLEAEMLYEELLPVQLEYRNVTPPLGLVGFQPAIRGAAVGPAAAWGRIAAALR